MRKSRLIGVLAVAGALALAGCSADAAPEPGTSTGASDVAGAAALAADYAAPVTEDAISDDIVAPAAGKSVVVIPCAYAAENCHRAADAYTEAAEALGWDAQMIDPAGDAEKQRQAVRTAIQMGVDGILFHAINGDELADVLAEAREAGIFTINVQGGENVEGQFDANIEPDAVGIGHALGVQMIVDQDGEANIVMVDDPSFKAVIGYKEGFLSAIDEFCGGCTVANEFVFQIANLNTQLPTQTQAALSANPDADVVWAAYDAAAAAIKPTIERSANAENLSMYSQDGNSANLQWVADGELQRADVAASTEWMAYEGVNLLNKLFAGQEVELNNAAPFKLFTADNVTTIPWDGDVDWKSAYLTAWGVD